MTVGSRNDTQRRYRLGMAEEQKPQESAADEAGEPDKLDLDPELAQRARLKVDPDAPVAQDEPAKDQGDPLT